MIQSEITTAVRYAIKEPSPILVSDTAIASVTLRGVDALWQKIKESDPSFCHRRTSLTSRTNIFAWPSDCLTIRKVWDMKTNAASVTAASNATPIVIGTATEKTITDATNADPIVITSTAHGYETGDSIFIAEVLGNTEANGTFDITKVDADSFSLDDSEGNAAYTSGGKAILASLAHGLSEDDIAVVHGVVGTTTANGTWRITKSSLVIGSDDKIYKCIAAHTAASANKPITGANYAIYWEDNGTGEAGKEWVSGTSYLLSDYNFSLDGSVGATDYTSGGKVFEERSTFTEIRKVDISRRTGHNNSLWYPRGKNIVIDKVDFTYDIIIDYIMASSAITDIPAEYHEGLVSFCVIHLLPMAQPGSKTAADTRRTLDFHTNMWNFVNNQIQETLRVTSEPAEILDTMHYDHMLS